ncbi:hypothetical protein AVEN_95981-1 [Araneus ventricosus]|uniref:Fibrinogen C-terminal domain-containing protein n=1 Tax=Araneus ventricosus TaxID=182803 RepID=A0A4Y2B3G5_ARAVE|nr:hypothetical protein AVEN_95981-1 [Araneus ventricosus]
MKTFLCFSAFCLLIFTDICSAAATKTIAPNLEAAKKGDCSKCPKHERPMDCAELMENGVTESGVYTVYPRSRLTNCKSIDVYCDMETDGGGWTVSRKSLHSKPLRDVVSRIKKDSYAILTGING